jgi:hypothetical protein
MGIVRWMLLPAVLLVVTASAGEATGTRYGISVTTPESWHVRVQRGAIVAATVPLPPDHGALSPRLSRALHAGDLGLLLYEDAPAREVPFDTHLYSRGYPRTFSPRDFRPLPPSGSNPRIHSVARRNFAVAGRYFDLFVEAGAPRPTLGRVAGLNALVRSLRITPGDFYPGKAPPARFRPAHGWFTVHSPTVPIGPATSSFTIASTIPFRDCLTCFPPRKTVKRLPPSGIVIFLALSADNRDPPTAAPFPTTLHVQRHECGSFEGIPTLATCPVHAQLFLRYRIDGWVIFGRERRPTPLQRARANTELGRLELPMWPRWPVP